MVHKFSNKKNLFFTIDGTIYYTHFNNRIAPDYETDVNKIIYSNLEGYGTSKGISLTFDWVNTSGFRGNIGGVYQEVTLTENNITSFQLLTERTSFVWSIGYNFHKKGISIDYTGKTYGPMELPLLGELDQRDSHSPWFSIQNIQITKQKNNWEFYTGVKNLLNFTPAANSIARSFDPFDKNVSFNTNGDVIPTDDNPQALTFDPTYVYASNQGIRLFIGLRYKLQ